MLLRKSREKIHLQYLLGGKKIYVYIDLHNSNTYCARVNYTYVYTYECVYIFGYLKEKRKKKHIHWKKKPETNEIGVEGIEKEDF